MNIRGKDRYKVTKRQKEFLAMAAAGMTLEETAERMGIGKQGVISHSRNVREAMKAKNITHAVALGIRSGLIF